MKKGILLFLLAICSSFIGQATTVQNPDIAGAWEFKAPAAPYEYSTGLIVVDNTDGALQVKIKFDNGGEITGKEITYNERELKFQVFIESDVVKLALKMNDEGKLVGVANGPEGAIEVSATKKNE